ncbi:MAG: hypothetical protein AB1894_08680 [Chloroflexota bacterium]
MSAYTLNLRPARVKELADGLQACYEMLNQDLLAFAAFLEAID